MSKAPAFQFYVRDWLSDPQLRMCSHVTKGIWIDLLCLMWEAPERGKLEGTADQLARMVSANNGDFELFLKEAQETSFCNANVTRVTDGSKKVTIINRRMQREEKERKLHANRQFRYRERHKDNLCDVNSDGKVTVPSSSSSSNTPIVPKGDGDDLFDIFWLNYPKKIGKQAARKAWNKIRSPKEALEKMKTVLPRQKASEQWNKDNGQFIPNPATYLNQGRWEDETI